MTTINDRMSHAFGLDATGWTGHANPWSVYTRIPVPVLFAAAVWAREWLGWWCLLSVAAVCLWAAVNPRAFPPPADLDSWRRGACSARRSGTRARPPRSPRGTASRPGC
jgi:hypothetical protein